MRCTYLLMILSCSCVIGLADDVPTVHSVSREHAKQCRVFPVDHPDKPFVLREEAILRRQQNTVGNSQGYAFLWLDETGRPAALCDIFFFKNHLDLREMLNEWHSLSEQPLRSVGPGANDIERTFLNASTPGLDWKPVPDSPAPASSPRTRDLQMKRIAERFAVHEITSQEVSHDLRLLPQPIYEFEGIEGGDVVGGAIMAFCVETDPECLLFLEARRVDGQPHWMYAPLATSIERIFVKLEGQEVWTANPPVFAENTPHWKGFIKKVPIPVQTPATSAK